MNRLRCMAAFVCLVFAAPIQAQTKWTVTMQTDKLTDKSVLTATAQVRVDGPSSPAYELTQKCDGSASLPAATLATFDYAQRPRPILQWEQRFVDVSPTAAALLGVHVENGVMMSKDIRYRVDDERVKTIRLEGTDYANVGQAQFLHAQPSAQIAKATAGLDELAKALGVPPDSIGVPRTRLLVADVFPEETVEFSFAALTAKQRNDIYHWCFEPADKAAVAGKVAADKAVADETAAKARETAEALEQWCGSSESRVFPVGAERFQVQVGEKWVSFKDVWSQVQCAKEGAVSGVLGPPARVTNAPEVRIGHSGWLYNVNAPVWTWSARIGNVLRGYQFGGVGAYIINGVVVFQ